MKSNFLFKKLATLYYHRTSNLDPMLNSGKLFSLRHIKDEDPDKIVSVEPNRWSRERASLKALDAYNKMKAEDKDVDYIFMTKNAPLVGEDYGKYIIEKDIETPQKALNINLIPEEYKQKKAISLKRTTNIYVPEEELQTFKDNYKGYHFKPISDLRGKAHPDWSVLSLADKLLIRGGLKDD